MLNSYDDYLRLSELLSLQSTCTAGSDREEVIFIVCHQVHELWFKVLRHEVLAICHDLKQDRWPCAMQALRRSCSVLRAMAAEVEILATLPAANFLKIRENLAGISGLDSKQYRELEFLLGIRRPDHQTHDSNECLSHLAQMFLSSHESEGTGDLLHERLLDFEQAFDNWRYHHAVVARRLIGDRPGTGGTTGVAYLQQRVFLRVFPFLQPTGQLK